MHIKKLNDSQHNFTMQSSQRRVFIISSKLFLNEKIMRYNA